MNSKVISEDVFNNCNCRYNSSLCHLAGLAHYSRSGTLLTRAVVTDRAEVRKKLTAFTNEMKLLNQDD